MITVKGNFAILMVLAFLIISPVALSFSLVSAEFSNYTIDSVDHTVQVLYSGHVVVSDTIYITGQLSGEFLIGLPYQYSADVLKAVAYDENHVYPVNLGVQMGSSGFYGAQVNFKGASPSEFTVVFTLSNRLLTEETNGLLLDYPAYPSLTQSVGSCNVNLVFPSTPARVTISKVDGAVNGDSYQRSNLPAYTYAVGQASFQAPLGSLQLMTISNLDRQITFDSAGNVAVSSSYRIINNSTNSLYSFAFNVPADATDILVTDSAGRTLTTAVGPSANGNTLLANATLVSFPTEGQLTLLTVQYNLPSPLLAGSLYALDDFMLFPQFSYYVNQATVTFTPPEGATITNPQVDDLDGFSMLSRNAFQDTLTVTRNGVSPIDFSGPQQNSLNFSYTYNAVWASLRPTFWAFLLAAVGCIAIFAVRSRQPAGKGGFSRTLHLSRSPSTSKQIEEEDDFEAEVLELKPGDQVTADIVNDFIEAYEDRKELSAELKALDAKALKGKIPRRQYKVQRRSTENRLKSVMRATERTKEMLRRSSSVYADIAKQLDAAEADLAETEGKISSLESRYNKGDLPLEYYKKTLGDYQKRKEKAESNIGGILLRLREKIR